MGTPTNTSEVRPDFCSGICPRVRLPGSDGELFTGEWEQVTGCTFDRWADIATIIGLLDSYRRHPPARAKQHDIETMLQHAIDELDR